MRGFWRNSGLHVGLLALLVTLTLVGYLALGFRWQRNRQAFVERTNVFAAQSSGYPEFDGDPPSLPLVLRLFGATSYRTIQYSIESHDRFRYEDFVTDSDEPKILTEDERRELARVRQLFPEARVNVWLAPIPTWPPS